MRSRHCIRYLCDHCSKGMFQKPSMAKHERVCFHNPTRACWACEYDGGIETTPMPALIAALETGGLPALRIAANNCPACIVSAMIQQRKADPGAERFTIDYAAQNELVGFNYKDEMNRFCQGVRESRPEDFM